MRTDAFIDRLAGRLSSRTNRIFYLVVLGIALAGSGQVAVTWLDWPPLLAFGAVAAVELGAVALSVHGDRRRQLGERAVFARLLSAAVAAGGVAINLLGHQHHPGQAAFFAGMSALGYLVWLIDSGARRRDHLRAERRLPQPRQTYSAADWLLHPGLTMRARRLADRTPSLGRFGSIDAAREEIATAERIAATKVVVRDLVVAEFGADAARMILASADFNAIGRGYATGDDHDQWSAALRDRFSPARLLGQVADRPAVEAPKDDVVEAEIVPDSAPVSAGRSTGVRRLDDAGARRVAVALKKAEPKITPQEAAPLVTRAPRTVREIWAKEKTGTLPAVGAGKGAADKVAEPRSAMGFQPPEVRS